MQHKVPTSDAKISADNKVGLLAGWGSFPVEVAQRCVEQGKQVYVIAFKGHADERLEEFATEIRWMGLLKIGAHMRFFNRMGVKHVAMAGKLFKERILYHGLGWIAHVPDFTCYRILGASFVTKQRDTRDDTLLTAVANAYQERDMNILPVTHIAPQLLAEEGCLTRRKPSRSQLLDIQFGWAIARQMGNLDIGQSMTVKNRNVLGVEAVEGTDALIARTGKLCPRGGFTLVKVAKPKQDMRFDVPTIGLRTVHQLVSAGGTALAIEANRTVFVDRQATIDYANANGLVLVSMRSDVVEANVARAA